VINEKHIVAGVSGGVHIDPWPAIDAAALQADRDDRLRTQRGYGQPKEVPPDAWWWD
jgi:hypothetical protein